MERMVAVIAAAAGAAVVAYFVMSQAATQRRYENSLDDLDAAIQGREFEAGAVAWYQEPVNAALVAGVLVLVVGFMIASQSGKGRA